MKATVEQLFTCSQWLCVLLLVRAQGRSQTLLAPWLHPRQCVRGGCFVSSCLPLSLCLCCFTPAAARHQARLLQLTLDYINNGLLYTVPSSNTLQTKLLTRRADSGWVSNLDTLYRYWPKCVRSTVFKEVPKAVVGHPCHIRNLV